MSSRSRVLLSQTQEAAGGRVQRILLSGRGYGADSRHNPRYARDTADAGALLLRSSRMPITGRRCRWQYWDRETVQGRIRRGRGGVKWGPGPPTSPDPHTYTRGEQQPLRLRSECSKSSEAPPFVQSQCTELNGEFKCTKKIRNK